METLTELCENLHVAKGVSVELKSKISYQSAHVKEGFQFKNRYLLLFDHFGVIFGYLQIISFGWFFY